VIDEQRVSYVCGKTARLISKNIGSRRACPVALSAASIRVVRGRRRQFAGHVGHDLRHIQKLRGSDHGEMTGLPIRRGDIMLEGEIPPRGRIGMKAIGGGPATTPRTRPSPLIRIKSVYHHNDPILTVLPDFRVIRCRVICFGFCAAGLWKEIGVGITDVAAEWVCVFK
jgi:hypothetical protein